MKVGPVNVHNLVPSCVFKTLKYKPKNKLMGSGNGAFDRVVASDTKGPGFESSHQQYL